MGKFNRDIQVDKFYGDMLDLFKQTKEYNRYLTMGLDITSFSYDGPEVDIFFEVPHNSIYYKRYRVYAVEFFFGRRLVSVGKKTQLVTTLPYIVHIDLAGLNRLLMVTDEKNSEILIESNEFPELLAEREKVLAYRSDIKCNTDLSDVIFYPSDKIVIKSFDSLISYIDSNAKISFNELVFNIDMLKESNDILYRYLSYFTINKDELITVFGDKLLSKKASMNIYTDIVCDEYSWSMNSIRRVKNYLDDMSNEIGLLDKKDRILNYMSLIFSVYPSKLILNDSKLLSDSVYKRVFKDFINEKFSKSYILDFYNKTGIRLDIKAYL